jgi:ribosomal protein S13
MTQIAELLKNQAEELNAIVQAGMEKEAAVTALIEEGIDASTAKNLVESHVLEKSASEQTKILTHDGISHLVQVLEKTASYVADLERQVEEYQIKIDKSPAEFIKQAETHTKLTSIGFSDEEIKSLNQVSPELLEKLANSSGEPWGMGQPEGMQREKTDPLLEFLLS